MTEKICACCGRRGIKHKEIEIRRVNSTTMKVDSWEKVIELECLDCGWIGTLEMLPALSR